MSILVRLDKQSSVSRMSETQHAGAVFYRLDPAGIKINPVREKCESSCKNRLDFFPPSNSVRWKKLVEFLKRDHNSVTSFHYRTWEENHLFWKLF